MGKIFQFIQTQLAFSSDNLILSCSELSVTDICLNAICLKNTRSNFQPELSKHNLCTITLQSRLCHRTEANWFNPSYSSISFIYFTFVPSNPINVSQKLCIGNQLEINRNQFLNFKYFFSDFISNRIFEMYFYSYCINKFYFTLLKY